MVDSTLMGLEPGFDVSVLDLLYGVMLPWVTTRPSP